MRAQKQKVKHRAIHHRSARQIKPEPQKQAIQRIPPADLSLPERVEQVLIGGDLTALTPTERVEYYQKVCKSLGLNALTRPFEYILFREADGAPAKLQLYARADCAAQLRKIYRIQVLAIRREQHDEMSYAEADVQDGTGKRDTAIGIVPLSKWKDRQRIKLEGRELANAIMKTETKAKRRATLSVCGLAFLDESELDTMRVIGGVTRDGRIYGYKQLPEGEPVEVKQETVEEEAAHNPHLAAFLEKEKASRVSTAQSVTPEPANGGGVDVSAKPTDAAAQSMFSIQIPGTETFKLTGPRDLLLKFKDTLIRPFWDKQASAFLLETEQFVKLGLELEKQGILLKRDPNAGG